MQQHAEALMDTNQHYAKPKIIRSAEVVDKTGLSRTTIWRLEKTNDFPARRTLGPNSVGWLESEIDAWIRDRILR